MPYLKEDIISGKREKNKNYIIYGKAKDKVEIVAEHGDVIIVQLKGNRFPVHKNKLT